VWAYIDSSALVKRYVQEAGRRGVLQLLRRRSVVSSAILLVALRSAVRRRAGDGTLAAAGRLGSRDVLFVRADARQAAAAASLGMSIAQIES
jgi:predicted nucleic acid-binding protein